MMEEERMNMRYFSNPRFNELMGMGKRACSSGKVIVAVAPAGTHMNLFLSNFLQNKTKKEKAVYFSVNEPPLRLLRKNTRTGQNFFVFNLSNTMEKNTLDKESKKFVIDVDNPCHPTHVLEVFNYKFGKFARKENETMRIVFDSVSSYRQMIGEKDTLRFFRELVAQVKILGDSMLIKINPEMQDQRFLRNMEIWGDIILELKMDDGYNIFQVKRGFAPEHLYTPIKYHINEENRIVCV